MYLKSLTIRGFKSFASSTTLNFEQGITAVVGPNGSGKSNVVDAIAWVLGEQGAKSLRGGKMEDVIFAGSSGRAPLGRAEVLLTIDNSDGALPIDYSEVTISRTMFRNGGSEYAINGTTSRLLDIQELLSDSGIGREMHVIVGQGQLRDILLATPEQRRGYIEEAAGVLKHRKRKEKALRKLDAMEINLTRVEDLTNELRRQLKPLGRQAEVARRANVIQSDVRDSRLRLLADDLTQMKVALEAEIADETALRERRSEVESELTSAKAKEAILDASIAESAPLVERAQNTFYQLGAQQERLRSTMALAKERVRLGETEEEEVQRGRDPEEIDREAHALRVSEAELAGQVDTDRLALNTAISERTAAQAALAAEDARLHAATRAVVDRREGLARIAGQVAAAKSRLDARSAEIERLEDRLQEARARADEAAQEFT
ncbi:MAG: AAA family ATPase, partial [Actinomycetes bacterium]